MFNSVSFLSCPIFFVKQTDHFLAHWLVSMHPHKIDVSGLQAIRFNGERWNLILEIRTTDDGRTTWASVARSVVTLILGKTISARDVFP